MSETTAPEKKKAYEIPCGNAVIVPVGDGTALCMKAERMGKEYIHHYAVPLHPHPAAATALIYLDPEDEILDCRTTLTFTVGGAEAGAAPGVGDVFRSDKGTFMKVHEDPKSQKMFAYLNLETGEVMRRQERRLEAVYREWSAGGGESVTVVELLTRYTA